MNIAQAIPLADTWGMHGDVGAGWMILMMSLMVLFWGAVIFGIVWLIRGATRGDSPPGSTVASKRRARFRPRTTAHAATFSSTGLRKRTGAGRRSC